MVNPKNVEARRRHQSEIPARFFRTSQMVISIPKGAIRHSLDEEFFFAAEKKFAAHLDTWPVETRDVTQGGTHSRSWPWPVTTYL